MDFLTKVQANDQMQEVDQEEKKEEGMELKEIIKEMIIEEISKAKAVDFYNLAKQKIAEIELEKQALKDNSDELKETTIEFKAETEALSKNLIDTTNKISKELTKKLIDSNTTLLQMIEDKKVFESLEQEIKESFIKYSNSVEEKTSKKITELERKLEKFRSQSSIIINSLIGAGIVLLIVLLFFIYSSRAFKSEITEAIRGIEKTTEANGELTKGIHEILTKDKAYWYDKENNTIFFREKEKKKTDHTKKK